MRWLWVIMISVLSFSGLWADKKTLVVMNFEANGLDPEIGVAISEMYRVYFQTLSTNYVIIERARLNDILKEQQLQLSGAVQDEQELLVGRLLSADYIILGSITTLGDTLLIQSRIVKSDSGEIVKSGLTQSPGLHDLPAKTRELVFLILGYTPGETPVPVYSQPAIPQPSVTSQKQRYTYQSWYTDGGGKHSGGKIVLMVEGDKVQGTSYEAYGNAEMTGAVQGDKLAGYYKAAYGHGNFEFRVEKDWKSLSGTYYQISNGAQGEWSGTLIKVEQLR